MCFLCDSWIRLLEDFSSESSSFQFWNCTWKYKKRRTKQTKKKRWKERKKKRKIPLCDSGFFFTLRNDKTQCPENTMTQQELQCPREVLDNMIQFLSRHQSRQHKPLGNHKSSQKTAGSFSNTFSHYQNTTTLGKDLWQRMIHERMTEIDCCAPQLKQMYFTFLVVITHPPIRSPSSITMSNYPDWALHLHP